MDKNHFSRKENRPPLKWIPIALILLFLAATGFGFLKSSFFLVDNIDILGLTTIKHDEIMAVANYTRNSNIFDVDLVTLTKRIEADPRIDKALIKRRFPSTLSVEVTERTKIAVMPYSGHYVFIDPQSFAVGITESYTEKDPPLITGIKPQQVLIGKKIEGNGLAFALLVTSILPPHIIKDISEINFKEDIGISVYMQCGTLVILGLGTRDEYLTRLDVFDSLFYKLDDDKKHASYIDVRFPKRPVIKGRK